jgi:hypothetical protein
MFGNLAGCLTRFAEFALKGGLMMATLERFRNRLGISERFFNVFLAFSVLWGAACLLLFMPPVRSLVIRAGELFIVRRPLTHPVWHERFVWWAGSGIVSYIFLIFCFFHNRIFTGKNSGRKLYFFMIGVSALIVFCVMFHANWIFGDDYEYVTTTAIDKYVPFLYTADGRFFPLGHIHYNILLFVLRLLGIHSGLPAVFHFMLIAVFHILSAVCLYSLLTKIKPFVHADYPVFPLFFLSIIFLLSTGFFMGLNYPETQLIMLLAVFMLMYLKALETDKKRYFAAAALSAVYATYCKEPMFGAFVIIALSNHLFRYKKESGNEKIFYWALVANAIVFLSLYYFLSFRHTTLFYGTGRTAISGFRFIASVFAGNPVLIVMFLFGVIRLFFVIVKKDRSHLFYDSLLFAGMGYTLAFIVLHLYAAYYFLPSIILFLPSLVYWTGYLREKKTCCAFFLCAFFTVFFVYNARSEINTVRDTFQARREFMPYMEDLFSEYRDGKKFIWYESDKTETGSTFYKGVRNWRKIIENAFLNYLNRSGGKDFFTVAKGIDEIDLNKNILFFYPLENDMNGPMPDELADALQDRGFTIFKDSYGIAIYRQQREAQ